VNANTGGEKRRLALARVLLRQAPILILDEPLANLDEGNAASIEDLILSIEDRMVITISHQFSSSKLPRFKRIYSF
jgi:ABC-type transport system involved in cytochrome bd biosynthesis fused ATPase/permease subunit